MTHWLDTLDSNAREEQRVQRQLKQTANSQQLLERNLGRTYWSELLAATRKDASEFDTTFGNYVMSAQILGPDSLEVVAQFTKGTRNVVAVSYHPARRTVGWGVRNGDPMGIYVLRMIANTHVLAFSGDKTLTPDDLATDIVTFAVS